MIRIGKSTQLIWVKGKNVLEVVFIDTICSWLYHVMAHLKSIFQNMAADTSRTLRRI